MILHCGTHAVPEAEYVGTVRSMDTVERLVSTLRGCHLGLQRCCKLRYALGSVGSVSLSLLLEGAQLRLRLVRCQLQVLRPLPQGGVLLLEGCARRG